MSGARVGNDGTGTPELFRSNFSSPAGNGDQIWDMKVQANDDKILANGFHTTSTNPVFGLIRLCLNPADCNTAGPGGNGGGGSSGQTFPLSMALTVPANALIPREPRAAPVPLRAVAVSVEHRGADDLDAPLHREALTDVVFARATLAELPTMLPLEEKLLELALQMTW
jgi:hypothetical protein